MKVAFGKGREQEEEQNTLPSSPDHQREMSENLYMAIVRIQASQNIADWNRACERAAVFLGESTKEFERLVVDEARKRYNSLFMKQLNEAKKTIEKSVREREDNFRVPCKICGEPMHFSSSDENWEQEQGQVKQMLAKAFENWTHRTCLEETKTK